MAVAKYTSGQLSVITKDDKAKKEHVKVLDEDTYIASLEKIIQKDFFPDLERLNAQAEYIDALERKDTAKVWELRRKYSTTRRPTTSRTPSSFATPSTFETPSGRPTTGLRPPTESGGETGGVDVPKDDKKDNDCEATHNPEPNLEDPLEKIGLDQFLMRNTSEDNQSFEDIMNESEHKHRIKHAWLFEQGDKQNQEKDTNVLLPPIEQQAIMSTSKDLQTWSYVPKNAVMYTPDSAPESGDEFIERTSRKPRVIVHNNTRFSANPFNREKNKEVLTQAASSHAMMLQGKIGHDGKEVLPSTTPKVGGYSFVATPSPAPGVDASPLMTWGEIDGTPYLLDPSETPLLTPKGPGPTFKVPDVPRRDKVLLDLAEKASKAHRAKKQEAIKQCRASFSRTASPGTPKADRLSLLSPAAQRLATKKFGVRLTSDKALRDSYTPSPSRTSSRSTPTPKSTKTTPKVTDAGNTPGKKPASSSITDDLLQLPKRPRAQEFF